MIWRPYIKSEPWDDDAEALPYVFMTVFDWPHILPCREIGAREGDEIVWTEAGIVEGVR